MLTHRRLANRDAVVHVGAGWHTHLDIPADRLDDREPPAFWSSFDEIEGA